jgi:hypothetical protein
MYLPYTRMIISVFLCPMVLAIRSGLSPQPRAIVAKVCLVCFISRCWIPAAAGMTN